MPLEYVEKLVLGHLKNCWTTITIITIPTTALVSIASVVHWPALGVSILMCVF